jgi:y4mF family transcriptional regulator
MQLHIIIIIFESLYVITYKMKTLAQFVKEKRVESGLTQEEFADRSGVALTVIRKIEQGKGNLNLEKANQILRMFGHQLAPVSSKQLNAMNQQSDL